MARPFANESLFYNINYLHYPAGTAVKSLTLEDLEANRGLIAKVGRELMQPEINVLLIQRTATGTGAIAVLRLRLEATDLSQAMRSTILTAFFDGKQTVAAPVGEFFGSGPGLNPFEDWWRMAEEEGWMTCWWPMPFRELAEIRVTHQGIDEPVEVELADIGIADWRWTDRTMRFHTARRESGSVRQQQRPAVRRGLELCDHRGSLGPWWGEGDEKIFVDGEAFPSHFGTGSEDYYGYAFNGGSPFSTPFHCQPMAKGNSSVGHTTNGRVRVHDPIPFKTTFKLDMELYHWQPNTRNDYAEIGRRLPRRHPACGPQSRPGPGKPVPCGPPRAWA